MLPSAPRSRGQTGLNVLKPHQRTTVATLLDAGTSQRQIGRLTGVDRKTIRPVQLGLAAERSNSPVVATGSALQTPPPRPPAAPPTSVSACALQPRLHRGAVAAREQLHGDLPGPGRSARVHRRLQQRQAPCWRPARERPSRSTAWSSPPGQEAQVDYGEGALTRVPGTERHRRPRLFVITLRYSRRSFRRVLWKSSQETWARLHELAWRYFGGSCRYVVLDVALAPPPPSSRQSVRLVRQVTSRTLPQG